MNTPGLINTGPSSWSNRAASKGLITRCFLTERAPLPTQQTRSWTLQNSLHQQTENSWVKWESFPTKSMELIPELQDDVVKINHQQWIFVNFQLTHDIEHLILITYFEIGNIMSGTSAYCCLYFDTNYNYLVESCASQGFPGLWWRGSWTLDGDWNQQGWQTWGCKSECRDCMGWTVLTAETARSWSLPLAA